MSKQFLAILAIIVVVFVGVFAFTRSKSDTPGSNNGDNSAQTSNHTIGAGNKGVTLVEYGDFQCPACKSYYPVVKQVKELYGDDITFQFMHFPLTQIHPNAMVASRAAEAAGKQGKFFEMHDFLYENQDSWSSDSNPTPLFESFAAQLELDIDQFKSDMMSAQVLATINADLKSGQALGANSTPTFVINGKKLDKNPTSLDEFKQLIDEEIARANPTN